MRVVSYIRMSTTRQEASPEQQRAAIAAHAKKARYKIAREYADLGASGDNAAKRPQFRQMIADGSAGKFDRIVVYDRSRFGRFDAIEFGRWVSPLRDAGVELETLAEGVESWEDFGGRIIGLVAQEAKHSFLIDLSRAVTRGMVAKAENAEGYSNPTPFGYDRSTTVVGNRRHSVLTINEERAAIVREIFETYNSPNGSLAAVAEMLNTRGVPPIRGGRWRRNTIGRILQNEAYIGVSAWGRRQKGRYHSRGPDGVMKRKRGAKTEFVDPIRHEGAVPAIIDRETFARAAELMAARHKSPRAPRLIRPLSGLVRCSKCGATMHADGDGFRCQNSAHGIPAAKRCPSVRVPAGPVLEAVAREIVKAFGTPTALRSLQKEIERQLGETRATADLAALEARHRSLAADVRAGLERAASMPKGLVGEFTAMLERKAAERDRLADEIEAIRSVKPTAPVQVAKEIVGQMKANVEALTAGGDPAEVNAALRAMGVSVSCPPAKMPFDAEITAGDAPTTVLRNGQSPERLLRLTIRVA